MRCSLSRPCVVRGGRAVHVPSVGGSDDLVGLRSRLDDAPAISRSLTLWSCDARRSTLEGLLRRHPVTLDEDAHRLTDEPVALDGALEVRLVLADPVDRHDPVDRLGERVQEQLGDGLLGSRLRTGGCDPPRPTPGTWRGRPTTPGGGRRAPSPARGVCRRPAGRRGARRGPSARAPAQGRRRDDARGTGMEVVLGRADPQHPPHRPAPHRSRRRPRRAPPRGPPRAPGAGRGQVSV